jgi:heme-degrading monooxygenase HmoA
VLPQGSLSLHPPGTYVVVFTSRLDAGETPADYAGTSARMFELAARQPGYLGADTAREEAGITVAYFRDEESVRSWREMAEHRVAQERGRDEWYSRYTMHVARIERSYEFDRA